MPWSYNRVWKSPYEVWFAVEQASLAAYGLPQDISPGGSQALPPWWSCLLMLLAPLNKHLWGVFFIRVGKK